MEDKLKSAINELMCLTECICDEAYKSIGRRDPQCNCDYREDVEVVNEALQRLSASMD